jgi:c-di-GMP-related signal transduction protein
MEVFVARHPVFDEKKDVFGYELEFRSGFEAYYQALEAERDTVDLMAFVNYGELVGGKKGFINFPRNLLAIHFPILFARDSVVAGISCQSETDEAVLSRCGELRDLGYTLAVNDLTPDQLDNPLLKLMHLAEIDFARLSPDDRAAICRRAAERGIKTVARGVGTVEEFDDAVAAGYAYFHGEFFAKPVVKPGRQLAANKLTYMQLIREVNDPALEYEDIASLIERDVSMTYKLLKFMNSAWFGLRFEVRSVRHALVLLGPNEIKRWVSMVAVRNTGENKPDELLLRSLTRAKAAEQVGILTGREKEASELFLMGMFSVIDALTDTPMEKALTDLPLKEQIKAALLGEDGTGYRAIYDAIVGYEKGDWDLFSRSAAELSVDEQEFPELFRDALKWAGQALQET